MNWEIFPSSTIVLNSFLQCFKVFIVEVFSHPCLGLFQCIFFLAIMPGTIFFLVCSSFVYRKTNDFCVCVCGCVHTRVYTHMHAVHECHVYICGDEHAMA